jgi:hypothetical protein
MWYEEEEFNPITLTASMLPFLYRCDINNTSNLGLLQQSHALYFNKAVPWKLSLAGPVWREREREL